MKYEDRTSLAFNGVEEWDQQYWIETYCRKKDEEKPTKSTTFIDLEKAFDHVNCNKLF